MSIAVNTYPAIRYRQTPVGWPVKIFDPPKQKPLGVMLNFNWAVYFAAMNNASNIAVDVDVNSGGTSQGGVIDKIVTAKIDNSNSNVPILIWFPDSGDVVTCPPQTIATLPCTTNGSTCKIIAQGLNSGNLPLTNIIFYNYFIPPSVDPLVQLVFPQYLGSPTIQRGNFLTPGFGPPALGDQAATLNASFNNGSIGPLTNIILPATTGFYYVTAINVSMNLFRVQYAVAGANLSFADFSIFDMTSGQILLPLRVWNASATSTSVFFDVINTNLFNVKGMNLRLDATHNYGMILSNVAAGTGVIVTWAFEAFFWFSYTLNPS